MNFLSLSRECLIAKQRYERAASAENAVAQRLKKLLAENDPLRKGSQQAVPENPKAQTRRAIEIGAVRERLIAAEMARAKAEADYREAAKMWREANPVVKVPAAPIISRLPQMTPADTMSVWINALRILGDESKDAEMRREAEGLVEAIEEVWKRRASGRLPDGWFRWPDTLAPGGNGSLLGEDWMPLGPLKVLGYTVGAGGHGQALRWAILRRVFEGVLPPVFPADYLSLWGAPGSPRRLSKMAESIASFARSAKRRDAHKLAHAIHDWEIDLRHLYNAYYVGRFRFDWPRA